MNSVANSLLSWLGIALLLALALVTATNTGCIGCRAETPQERAARVQKEEEERIKRLEEEKKRNKPAIETQRLTPQPSDQDSPLLSVKPGHWMIATLDAKANYEDWVGTSELQTLSTQGQPMAIDRTPFSLRTSRPAALVKGQAKSLETVLFAPGTMKPFRINSTLRERNGSLAVPPSPLPVARMLPHQYHLVVLAEEPQRYAFLKSLRCIRAPIAADIEVAGIPDQKQLERQYLVVSPAIDQEIALSDNPLCWTTIAYVLWDEVDPKLFDAGQQAAMIDWLQWGGQLIVSGPDSLDLLRGSWLDPYLPAESEGAQKLLAKDLEAFGKAYNVSRRADRELKPSVDWSGVRLKLRPEAQPLDEIGTLMAERRVGRGRVIVSAMQLAQRDLINWSGGYENFFNALVLRRPPRRFAWDDVGVDGSGSIYVTSPKSRSRAPQLDAGANTGVRYFARDTHVNADALRFRVGSAGDFADQNQNQNPNQLGFGGNFGGGFNDGSYTTLIAGDVPGGAGSWNDFNTAASAARQALREAAGVVVPKSSFVLGCVGAYLLVIVPLNWCFFKALGRVEWAWIAAPLIAVASTWVVVKQAQLDIGFVRAQTEIGILETQPNHKRGHLSRYTALYTSLSTTYELISDEPTTLAAPFPSKRDYQLLRGQQLTEVSFERQEKVRLRGLLVSSASTAMAHTEQMFDLGEGLAYDATTRRLVNKTDYDLQDLAIVRRDKASSTNSKQTAGAAAFGCWIGTLPARESASLSFSPLAYSEDAPLFLAERQAAAELQAEKRLDLEPLFRLALNPQRIEPGEVRAVARVDQVLPGVEIQPTAAQVSGAAILIAHLEYSPLPAPQADVNAAIDVDLSREN